MPIRPITTKTGSIIITDRMDLNTPVGHKSGDTLLALHKIKDRMGLVTPVSLLSVACQNTPSNHSSNCPTDRAYAGQSNGTKITGISHIPKVLKLLLFV